MNEMTTFNGKPAIKNADFSGNGRIMDASNRLPVGDSIQPRNLEDDEFNRKVLEQTYQNSPDTEFGGGNDNRPPNKIAGGFEENEKRENFENIPVVSQANYVFSHEIKGIINAINENPQKQGFFQKIGRNVANSVRNINYDIQNGLLGSSFNVLFNRGGKIESNSSYQDLLGKVGKLKELLGSVDNQHKQVILDRIVKLEKTISNTAKTITTLAKINSTPDKTVTEAEIASQLEYGSYDDATLNITKMQQRAIKTAGFFAVSLLSGGLGAFAGVLTGAVRIGATGIMARNDLENSKTSEYRREEIQNAVPEITQYTNTIKQQVIEGKFSENGIKDLLKTLQDLIVLQAGKLPPDVEEQMLNLSSVLYQFLGSNDRQLSEPDAIEASNNFKAFVDDLGVKVNPDNAKEEVQKLHKAELDKATKKAVIIGFGTTGLAFAGGLVWKHFMEAGGVEPHQVVNDLTSKLSKGPIPINGDHGNVEGAILATHENPDLGKINQVLGTNYTDLSQLQTKQIGEITIYSDNINGITPDEFHNSITRAAVPNDAFAPENTIEYSKHIDLIKANEVHGDTLTFRHDGNEITIGPGDSRNILNNDLDGFSTIVGKDANGNLVTADLTKMDTAELAELRKIMEQRGARYFAEQTEQIQQANIKDFFGIGEARGLGGDALRKQAIARIGGDGDPAAITKEMFKIRAEVNIGTRNPEAVAKFVDAQMQALKDTAGGDYERFVNAAASGEQIPVNADLSRSMYQKLLDQFPQYKTFITEQARWTNAGDGLPFQSVQGVSTGTAGIIEQNISGFGPFGWLNDRSNDLSNVFRNLPSPIPQEVKDFLAKAAPGMVYGGALGGPVGGASGLVKGIKTGQPIRGLGAGFARGAMFGGSAGALGSAWLGLNPLAAGGLGAAASLGTKAFWGWPGNAGNNAQERLFGATTARPPQAPASQPTQPNAEQQAQITEQINTLIPPNQLTHLLGPTSTIQELRAYQQGLQSEITRRNNLPEAERNNPVNRGVITRLNQIMTQINTRIGQLETAPEQQNQQGNNNNENEEEELTEANFGRFAQQMRAYRDTLQPRLTNQTTRERLLANDVERRRVVAELNQHLNNTRSYANEIREGRLHLNDTDARTLDGINRWTREALTTLDYEPRITRITNLINSDRRDDLNNVNHNLGRILVAMLEVEEELHRNVARDIRTEQSEDLLANIQENIQALRDRFGDQEINDIIDDIEDAEIPEAA